jgi:hypothetical protein
MLAGDDPGSRSTRAIRSLTSGRRARGIIPSRPMRPLSTMAMSILLRRRDVPVTVQGFRSSFHYSLSKASRSWAAYVCGSEHNVVPLCPTVVNRLTAMRAPPSRFQRQRRRREREVAGWPRRGGCPESATLDAEMLTCSTSFQGSRACSSPGGYTSTEWSRDGTRFGQDSDGNRSTTSR